MNSKNLNTKENFLKHLEKQKLPKHIKEQMIEDYEYDEEYDRQVALFQKDGLNTEELKKKMKNFCQEQHKLRHKKVTERSNEIKLERSRQIEAARKKQNSN